MSEYQRVSRARTLASFCTVAAFYMGSRYKGLSKLNLATSKIALSAFAQGASTKCRTPLGDATIKNGFVDLVSIGLTAWAMSDLVCSLRVKWILGPILFGGQALAANAKFTSIFSFTDQVESEEGFREVYKVVSRLIKDHKETIPPRSGILLCRSLLKKAFAAKISKEDKDVLELLEHYRGFIFELNQGRSSREKRAYIELLDGFEIADRECLKEDYFPELDEKVDKEIQSKWMKDKGSKNLHKWRVVIDNPKNSFDVTSESLKQLETRLEALSFTFNTVNNEERFNGAVDQLTELFLQHDKILEPIAAIKQCRTLLEKGFSAKVKKDSQKVEEVLAHYRRLLDKLPKKDETSERQRYILFLDRHDLTDDRFFEEGFIGEGNDASKWMKSTGNLIQLQWRISHVLPEGFNGLFEEIKEYLKDAEVTRREKTDLLHDFLEKVHDTSLAQEVLTFERAFLEKLHGLNKSHALIYSAKSLEERGLTSFELFELINDAAKVSRIYMMANPLVNWMSLTGNRLKFKWMIKEMNAPKYGVSFDALSELVKGDTVQIQLKLELCHRFRAKVRADPIADRVRDLETEMIGKFEGSEKAVLIQRIIESLDDFKLEDLTLFAALDGCKSGKQPEIEEGITKWMESSGTAIQAKWNA